MVPMHGIKAAGSFQDQCISELLNSVQADCVRRRDAVSNYTEMHGPELELVPKPSVHPTLSQAFVENFVEPCGFWPFSTKWADKVQEKGPRTHFVGQALVSRRCFSPISSQAFQRMKSACSPELNKLHLQLLCDANAYLERRLFRNIYVTCSLSVRSPGLSCRHRFCLVQTTSLQRPCPTGSNETR